ncbi:ATP-dependent Clp protease proteolytic subunit [Gemmata obscuriglobus]|uniref:ATP-dependent Clp protease proteolytic subunit n=1 Tax=Gemmata obscuriglobus TaxID=114 RepID=A0A2Z3H8E0_9BACT|nr:ATP-dependent Clp protease proteolytic subunit [Gemmata obscuriglobus]AWM41978.1 ATP-dependent Clp protease proteolytic subunit [Gemmata obscuriglobus]QEG32040.1 ATP-dependent Clp protease proteolytic subunit [Gemmata obscuriglobus]VTS11390.1 clp protease : ATP-dependent Clp protease proteolytic subunit OS=Isosphaera pallida (strain ATCC 43644 / DSM 9630 / IS1B) GN=clpP PE=3 SV=1: CLP_protease [Gemmata obscuriglobus UQM 2246]
MFPPFDPTAAAGPFEPLLQRGQYARQRTLTLDDLLLEQRIIFLNWPINNDVATLVIKQLLYLEYEKKSEDISLYINSPGGSVSATLAIYDTMQFMQSPINTFCMGLAASGAAVLLAAGSPKKRYAMPNSKVMIHQPYGQVGGQVSDIEIQANEILRERGRLNEILAKHTGQPVEIIARETDRDKYYHADEAKAFGLVDEVLVRPELKK